MNLCDFLVNFYFSLRIFYALLRSDSVMTFSSLTYTLGGVSGTYYSMEVVDFGGEFS